MRNPNPHFAKQNIGHNTLRKYIKDMFALAKIPLDGRHITNHSGKVTLYSNLFNNGFDDKVIRQRSGHRSDALNLYKRPSKSIQRIATNHTKKSNMHDNKETVM